MKYNYVFTIRCNLVDSMINIKQITTCESNKSYADNST